MAKNPGNNIRDNLLFPRFSAIALYARQLPPSQHKAQRTANARTWAVFNGFTSSFKKINTRYISVFSKSFIMIQKISKKWHSSKV
jgi:hypothetical protein